MTEKEFDEELKKGIYAKRTVMKAIKLKCMDCCGGSWDEVKKCSCKDSCFLHPFRLGKNPHNKKEYTEEQRAEMREKFLRRMGKL